MSDVTSDQIAFMFGCLDDSYSQTVQDYRTLVANGAGDATHPPCCQDLKLLGESVHKTYHKMRSTTTFFNGLFPINPLEWSPLMCKSVRYCSEGHQKAHWKEHKKTFRTPIW